MDEERLANCLALLVQVFLDNFDTFGFPVGMVKEQVTTPNRQKVSKSQNMPEVKLDFKPTGKTSSDATGCYEENGCFFFVTVNFQRLDDIYGPLKIMEKIKRVYDNHDVMDLSLERNDIIKLPNLKDSPYLGFRLDCYFTYESLTG